MTIEVTGPATIEIVVTERRSVRRRPVEEERVPVPMRWCHACDRYISRIDAHPCFNMRLKEER